eukprot:11811021-Alexandrium_andersonii.AAC.1
MVNAGSSLGQEQLPGRSPCAGAGLLEDTACLPSSTERGNSSVIPRPRVLSPGPKSALVHPL